MEIVQTTPTNIKTSLNPCQSLKTFEFGQFNLCFQFEFEVRVNLTHVFNLKNETYEG